MLVDTPGFDDPKKTDSHILHQIATVLAAQLKLGFDLKGVVYLWRVADIRHSGGAANSLAIFKKIVGSYNFKNVMLATNRWDQVVEKVGAQREKELRNDFWKDLIVGGARMTRWYGDYPSGRAIISRLLDDIGNGSVVLDLQKEMVIEEKALKDTTAGAYLNEDLQALRAKEAEEQTRREEMARSAVQPTRAQIRNTERSIESGKERIAAVDREQEELDRKIAEEVQSQLDKEKAAASKKKSLASRITAAVGVLTLFFNLDPDAKRDVGNWFNSLTDWVNNVFSS